MAPPRCHRIRDLLLERIRQTPRGDVELTISARKRFDDYGSFHETTIQEYGETAADMRGDLLT